MAKLTQFQSPIGNFSGDIGNLDTWRRLILGAVVLAVVFGVGASLVRGLQDFMARLPIVGGFLGQVPTAPPFAAGMAVNESPSTVTTLRPQIPIAV